MKRFFILLTLSAFSLISHAYDVEVDGIYYCLNNSTMEAEVADVQFQPDKMVITTDFNDYNVGDEPGTNKKTSASQLAKIALFDSQNVLKIPSQGKVNIVEGFEVDPLAAYTTTFYARTDDGKEASFMVNFSGNVVYSTAEASGRWKVSDKWTKIVVHGESAEDVTDGYLEIEAIRGSVLYIQMVQVDVTYGKVVEIPEMITSDGVDYRVTCIDEDAFSECLELNSVTIGNSILSIGAGAFQNCINLTSVTIGNSVTNISENAFSGCYNVTDLVYAEGTKMVLATGLNTIKSVVIPNSVTSIGNNAFLACSRLTSVVIPNSVTSIGEFSFGFCYNLTEMKCYAVNPPDFGGGGVFVGTQQTAGTLYVPAESIEAYKAAEQWRDWGTILPLTDNPTSIDGSRMADRGKASVIMLDGRKANSGIKKGIYIVNGKKLATKD